MVNVVLIDDASRKDYLDREILLLLLLLFLIHLDLASGFVGSLIVRVGRGGRRRMCRFYLGRRFVCLGTILMLRSLLCFGILGSFVLERRRWLLLGENIRRRSIVMGLFLRL